MAKYASKVIKQAEAWIGKKESDGSHKEIIDVYNSHKPLARGYKVKYTDAWCSTFVSAVAIKLGYTDIIPTECGCEKHIELFKKKGIWVEADDYIPSVGDIIFYDWEDDGKGDNTGRANHVGYVQKIANKTMTIIEGNYKNSVTTRTMKVNAKYIRGYGVPKYDKEITPAPAQTSLKYVKGDKIVLNGYLYRDAAGNGRGAKKTNYKGTITIVKKGAAKPYHIDSLGWVAENSISKQTTATTYTVKKGDYLIKIAKKFNVKWTNIAKKNNIKFPYIIKAGQKLIIK